MEKIKVQLNHLPLLVGLVGLKLRISKKNLRMSCSKFFFGAWSDFFFRPAIHSSECQLRCVDMPRHPWIPAEWSALFEDPCRKCASSSACMRSKSCLGPLTTLPETNIAPEHRGPLEVWRFLSETTIFRGYVSFKEGIYQQSITLESRSSSIWMLPKIVVPPNHPF